MNVIAINGSPKADGNTSEILKIMCSELDRQGIGTKILHIGKEPIRGCLACGYCARPDKDGCMIKKDIVNEAALEMCKADGIILAAPAYYAGIPGTMKAFLDRVFQSRKKQFAYKIGAAAAAGTAAPPGNQGRDPVGTGRSRPRPGAGPRRARFRTHVPAGR